MEGPWKGGQDRGSGPRVCHPPLACTSEQWASVSVWAQRTSGLLYSVAETVSQAEGPPCARVPGPLVGG